MGILDWLSGRPVEAAVVGVAEGPGVVGPGAGAPLPHGLGVDGPRGADPQVFEGLEGFEVRDDVEESLDVENVSESESSMSTLQNSIQELLSIDGATGAAIVDLSSGMALATGGNSGFNLDVAAAGNANVIQAKLRTMADLDITDEIEDILITLGRQYHLINVMHADETKGLFVYLVLNRQQSNLALARHKLTRVSKALSI